MHSKSRRSRRRAFIRLMVISPLTVVGVIAVWSYLHTPQISAHNFDPETWQQGSVAERGEMVWTLVESHLLLDKTHSEVLDMLGEPDLGDTTGSSLNYDIDISSGKVRLSWTYLLTVSYDNNSGVVTEVAVVQP